MLRIALIGTAFGFMSMSAAAGESEWYASVEGGYEFEGQFNASTDGDGGLALFATVGRRFKTGLRLEAEVGYRSTNEVFITAADITQTSIMFNGVYDVSPFDELSLMIGAGVGWDRVDIEDPGFSGDDVKAAVQLKLGAEVAIDDTIDLIAGYRLMYGYENEFIDIDNRTLTAGLRFGF